LLASSQRGKGNGQREKGLALPRLASQGTGESLEQPSDLKAKVEQRLGIPFREIPKCSSQEELSLKLGSRARSDVKET
jgi:hypothetical protein